MLASTSIAKRRVAGSLTALATYYQSFITSKLQFTSPSSGGNLGKLQAANLELALAKMLASVVSHVARTRDRSTKSALAPAKFLLHLFS